MRTPVRARHSWASSHGQGAAPETPRRSPRAPVKPGRSSRRRNMVATPGITVTPAVRQSGDSVGDEALDERDGDAGEQGREERAVDAERVRQRQRRQQDVAVAQPDHRSRPRSVGERQRAVREQRALGTAGAARGVEHERRRRIAGGAAPAACSTSPRPAALTSRPLAGRSRSRRARRPEVGQDRGPLLGLEQRVQRGDDDPAAMPPRTAVTNSGRLGRRPPGARRTQAAGAKPPAKSATRSASSP